MDDYWARKEKIDKIICCMLEKGLIEDSAKDTFRSTFERMSDEWLIDYLERVREIKEI